MSAPDPRQMSPNDQPAAGRRQIDDIERLRAVAIVLTLVAHLPFAVPWSQDVTRFLTRFWLGTGVDLFFVISGYVITRSMRETRRRHPERSIRAFLFDFWIRRAFRLLPTSFVLVAATLAVIAVSSRTVAFRDLGGLGPHVEASVAAILQIYNITGWLRTAAGAPHVLLDHYWSLSLEEQFYMLYPLLFLWTTTPRRLGALAAVVILSSFFLLKSYPTQVWWWFRIDGLFWGVLLAIVTDALPTPSQRFVQALRRIGPLLLGVGIWGLIETVNTLWWFSGANAVALLFAVLLVAGATADAEIYRLPRVVDAVVVAIGRRSYLYYLFHLLLYRLLYAAGEAAVAGWGLAHDHLLLAATVLAIVPALAAIEPLHRLVELPMRNRGRDVARRLTRPSGRDDSPMPAAPT